MDPGRVWRRAWAGWADRCPGGRRLGRRSAVKEDSRRASARPGLLDRQAETVRPHPAPPLCCLLGVIASSSQ
ncbi:hypothetical protein KPATCC21470_3893 [Kitasatospora purpeofusca]